MKKVNNYKDCCTRFINILLDFFMGKMSHRLIDSLLSFYTGKQWHDDYPLTQKRFIHNVVCFSSHTLSWQTTMIFQGTSADT